MARKIRIPTVLTEISDADVSWVSVVHKPANRIPFRVTKGEAVDADAEAATADGLPLPGEMQMNLTQMLGLARKNDDETSAGPALAAIVIRKSDSEVFLPKLAEAGFAIDAVTESDEGFAVLKQADYDTDDVIAFRVNDDVVALYSGVTKAFSPFMESASFGETMASQGFLPQLMLAAEAMQETVRTVLRSAESKEDAGDRIATVMDEFGAFVGAMTSALPEAAFKLEEIAPTLSIVEKTDEDVTESVEDEGTQDDEKGKDGDKADGDAKEQSCPKGQVWDAASGKCVDAKDADGDSAKSKDKDGKKDEDCPCRGEADCECDGEPGDVAKDGDDDDDGEELPAAAATAEDDTTETEQKSDEDFAETGGWDPAKYDVEDPDYQAALRDAEVIRKSQPAHSMIDASILRPEPPLREQKAETDEGAEDAGTETATKADADAEPTGEVEADEGLAKVLAGLAALTEAVTSLKSDVGALGDRVDSVEEASRKSAKALDGIVPAGGEEATSERHGSEPVEKSDGDDLWGGTALDRFVPGR